MDTVSCPSNEPNVPIPVILLTRPSKEPLTTSAAGAQERSRSSSLSFSPFSCSVSSFPSIHYSSTQEMTAAPPVTTSSLTTSSFPAESYERSASETTIMSQATSNVPITFTIPSANGPPTVVRGNSRMIIEAIDALRARKARPDEDRISHWVHRRYGLKKEHAMVIIHESVRTGSVIRVKYKDSISYRNPAKFARSIVGNNPGNPVIPGSSGIVIPFKEGLPVPTSLKIRKQAAHGTILGPAPLTSTVTVGDNNSPSASAAVIPSNTVTTDVTDDGHFLPSVTLMPMNNSQMTTTTQANITAVKRILRVLRQIILQSSPAKEDGWPFGQGASVTAIHQALLHQRHMEYTEGFISQVLKRSAMQGTVRLLPNGNYVLAAGGPGTRTCLGHKKGWSKRGRPPNSKKYPIMQPMDPSLAATSAAAVIDAQVPLHTVSGPVKHPVNLLQSQSVSSSSASAMKSSHSEAKTSTASKSILSASAEMSAAGRYLAHTKKQATKIMEKKQLKQLKALQVQQKQQERVKEKRMKQMKEFQYKKQQAEQRHHQQQQHQQQESCQRGRPVSKRKKFKKNLGPDFLEPSDLGMQYLKDTFEPKCDNCSHPASKNGKGKFEELLVCKDCNFKAHPISCLSYSPELAKKCRESPWQCMYCKDCCKCDGSGDVESILFCDACDKGYHMDCHEPRIRVKPSGTWICSPCLAERTEKKQSKKPKKTGINRKSIDNSLEDDEDDESSSVASEVIDVRKKSFKTKSKKEMKGKKTKPKYKGYVIIEEDEEEEEQEVESDVNGYEEEDEITHRSKTRDDTSKIVSLLSPKLDSMSQIYPNMTANPENWSAEEVESFIQFIGFTEEASLFREQEVDGLSLLLLKRSDILSGMSMKLGPAVKIYGHIQRLQMFYSNRTHKHSVASSSNSAQVNGFVSHSIVNQQPMEESDSLEEANLIIKEEEN